MRQNAIVVSTLKETSLIAPFHLPAGLIALLIAKLPTRLCTRLPARILILLGMLRYYSNRILLLW
jgi:hypothetical protein